MRQPYAHDAVLRLDPGADERAVGAAITVELCGGLTHPPPCPVAPHHTGSRPADGLLRVRVLFATEAEREGQVRAGIDAALAGGGFAGPDGARTTWQLRSSGAGVVTGDELAHARRLVGA